MDANPYLIYRLTSPSGRSYIGLTKMGLKERWRTHCTKARTQDKRHPLLDAIRKHGPEAFQTEVLESGLSKDEAKAAEVRWIRDLSPEMNLSPGGEDGQFASEFFWRELRNSPAAFEEYVAKLSTTRKRQMEESPEWREAIAAGGRAWREGNPREAYRLAMRNLRAAMRAVRSAHGLSQPRDPRFEKSGGRLFIDSARVRKARGNYRKRVALRKQWEQRDQSARKAAVSDGMKAHWSRMSSEQRQKALALTEKARAAAKAKFAADPEHWEAVKERRREGIRRYWAAKRAEKANQPTTS